MYISSEMKINPSSFSTSKILKSFKDIQNKVAAVTYTFKLSTQNSAMNIPAEKNHI